MLCAAILGTLAQEQALLARLKPHLIGASRNQVGLAGQRGTQKLWQTSADLQRQVHGPRHARRSLAGTCSSLAAMKPRSWPSYLS